MEHGIGIKKILVIEVPVELIFMTLLNFIGWYVTQTNKKLKISKSNVYRQYLAYHQGHAGYASGRYKSSEAIMAVAKEPASTASLFDRQLKNYVIKCIYKYFHYTLAKN